MQSRFMTLAITQAAQAAAAGETPVGAVLVTAGGAVLAEAHNLVVTNKDPTAHAEVVAIRAACHRLGSERLPDVDLYVTLEPCTMCAGAISFARIRRVYFGAYDAKGGALESGVRFFEQPTCMHRPEVYGGIAETECAAILRSFFRQRR